MDQPTASSQPLRVFVLELASSGFFGDQIGPSFRAEGRAMLDAALADLSRIPGVSVETILDDRERLRQAFRLPVDAVLTIAPEFGDLLRRFHEFLCRPWMRSLNCDSAALSLCADKWWFAQHLKAHGISTIPTWKIALTQTPREFPCVVKPRDGAGSWLVRRLDARRDWPQVVAEFTAAGYDEALCQPLIVGHACSIAALVRPDAPPLILPIAEQRLSADGQFQYLGGAIPARLPTDCAAKVVQAFRRVLGSVEGLNGYVSCDVIVPDRHPLRPVIVELNPRLTTSYIGYRQLCAQNLMELLLRPRLDEPPLTWKPGSVSFASDGTWTMLPD